MYGFNPYKLVAGFLVFATFTGLWMYFVRESEDARQEAMQKFIEREEGYPGYRGQVHETPYADTTYGERYARPAKSEKDKEPAVLAHVTGRFYYNGEIEYPPEKAEVFLVRGYAGTEADLKEVEDYLEEHEPVYYGNYEEGSEQYEEWRVEAEHRSHERFVRDLKNAINGVKYYKDKTGKVYEAETNRYGEIDINDVEPGDYLIYCMGSADDKDIVWVTEVTIEEGEGEVSFESSYTVSEAEVWEY